LSGLLELTLGFGKVDSTPKSKAADPDRVADAQLGISRFNEDYSSTPLQDSLCAHCHFLVLPILGIRFQSSGWH
jgi:hypothetical protein